MSTNIHFQLGIPATVLECEEINPEIMGFAIDRRQRKKQNRETKKVAR
jgi:hypothetical protein